MGKNVTKKEIISMEKLVSSILTSNNVLFMFLGAVMIFAMHAGFAFLEVGSVRKKNQVNALVKIITDWSISTITYFVIGFPLAYGIHFLKSADKIASMGMIDSMPIPGFDLMHFFFLLTFAAAIPAIISGGIAERAKFWPQAIAGGIFAGVIYPLFESMIWGQNQWFQNFIKSFSGSVFHDYAGSVVVHSIGGWLALPAIMIL
jgi:Amt family ammonium transporter